MQLTKQTNYALRMLMYCAAREEAVRLADVARFYGLSETFMHKVLIAARNGGLV
ncbi:MAG: Rrf2 family transcriptional regulator, partial [Pseudomonadota bacterium]